MATRKLISLALSDDEIKCAGELVVFYGVTSIQKAIRAAIVDQWSLHCAPKTSPEPVITA
jgi:hypothetical protein